MDEFMGLMNQVKNLAAGLKIKFEKETARGLVNDAKFIELVDRESVISAQETDLNQRDARISKIEDIVQLKEDAIALRREAEKAVSNAVEQREADKLANADAQSKNLIERKRLAAADAKHLDDCALLKKGWDQLRAKEKTYREEIKAIFQRKLG